MEWCWRPLIPAAACRPDSLNAGSLGPGLSQRPGSMRNGGNENPDPFASSGLLLLRGVRRVRKRRLGFRGILRVAGFALRARAKVGHGQVGGEHRRLGTWWPTRRKLEGRLRNDRPGRCRRSIDGEGIEGLYRRGHPQLEAEFIFITIFCAAHSTGKDPSTKGYDYQESKDQEFKQVHFGWE